MEFESELDRLKDRVTDIERVFDALATTIKGCIPGGTATSTLKALLNKDTKGGSDV